MLSNKYLLKYKVLILISFSILFISTTLFAELALKKNKELNVITYMAKSGLTEGTWDIIWNTHYAIVGSLVVYSEKKWDKTESSFSGRVLSIVGSYISYQGSSDGYSQGAAHPWSYVYFKTIDFTTGKEIKITDIFSEESIFKALVNDAVIQAALHGEKPKNLKSLLQQVDGGCDFKFNEMSLKSFVFHHVKKDKVAVRLGLSHGCEVMRGNFTQLGFYLDIPEPLRASFSTAKQNGLLMKEMIKLEY